MKVNILLCGVNIAVDSVCGVLLQDPVTLCTDNDKWQDVNVVSSLLKLFFRKLPESLITDGTTLSILSSFAHDMRHVFDWLGRVVGKIRTYSKKNATALNWQLRWEVGSSLVLRVMQMTT